MYKIKGSVEVVKNLTADRVIADTANQFADWTPLTDYLANDVVIESNKFYKRIADGTSGATFDNTEEAFWDSVGGGGDEVSPTAWATATDYILGATVSNEGRIYRASVAHTSTTFNADRANWVVVTALPLGDWLASTYYYSGEEVTASGDIWVRTTSGTSGLTFDETEQLDWSAKVYGVDIVPWTASTLFTANQLVTQAGRILQCITTQTSGTSYDAAEAANWTLIQTAPISAFIGSKYYYGEELVVTGTRTLRRTLNGTSEATFTNTEAAAWTLVSNTVIPSWAATTYFYRGEVVRSGTRLIARSSSGISGASFNGTEAVAWDIVEPIDLGVFSGGSWYYAGEQVLESGRVLQRITQGTSGGAMNAAEAANWTWVGTQNPQGWLPSHYYFTNERAWHPTTGTLLVSAGGTSQATFNATEGGNWSATLTNGNAKAWTASTYYYVGDNVTQAGSLYRRNTNGLSTGIFDETELLDWTLISGHPVTTVTGNYTVVETDSILDVTGAGPLTITIPAGRVNPELHVSRLHPNPVTIIDIATSGGETIVNPITGTAGTSTTVPGIANTNTFLDFYKVGTVYQVA